MHFIEIRSYNLKPGSREASPLPSRGDASASALECGCGGVRSILA
jgi:hypothetical protein